MYQRNQGRQFNQYNQNSQDSQNIRGSQNGQNSQRNQIPLGLSSLPIKTILKLHANVIHAEMPLKHLLQFRSAIAFVRSHNHAQNKVYMNIIVKLNNVCIHHPAPFESKLELLYIIKNYPTIPIIIERQIVNNDMSRITTTDNTVKYNEKAMFFGIKRHYIFAHVTNTIHNFLNHGTNVETSSEHIVGSNITMHFDEIKLPGTIVSINKKLKKTYIAFNFSELLNPYNKFFYYPQLL